jgi:hypothetical protein
MRSLLQWFRRSFLGRLTTVRLSFSAEGGQLRGSCLPASSRHARSFRPHLEQLESRQLLSTIGAVRWSSPDAVTHYAAYSIGGDDALYFSQDGGAYTRLGGYVKQVSARLSNDNFPQAVVIGRDDTVSVVDSNGNFTPLGGGYFKQISASPYSARDYTSVYAIGRDDLLYVSFGGAFIRLGHYVKQVSAGVDDDGRPQAFVIAGGDGLWKVDWSGNFTFQGTYAKQISAGVFDEVFAIATDNSAYVISRGVTTRLGGYLKQVSSGPGGRLFGIGSNDEVFLNRVDGRGWTELHRFAKEISAPAYIFGGDVVYTVGTNHEGYLHNAQGWTDLQQYLLGPSSGQTISAVSWLGDDGVKHHRTYAIGQDDALYVSQDGSPFASLGGYVKQVSAGLHIQNGTAYPLAFVIGGDDAVYVIGDYFDFYYLGGYAKQISAGVNDSLYSIGRDDELYLMRDYGDFVPLGGYVKQVSAGMDAAGNRRAYVIGGEDALWVVDDSGNFTRLGPYATQISATANDLGPTGRGVYAIDPNNTAYFHNTSARTNLGNDYVKQLSAGFDASGNSEVFAIASNDEVWVNHRDGQGFSSLAGTGTGSARQISAPAFAVGLDGDVVYTVDMDHAGYLHDAGGWTDLQQYLLGPSRGGKSGTELIPFYGPATGSQVISNPIRAELFALAGDQPAWQWDATREHGPDGLNRGGHVSRSSSPVRVNVQDSIFASYEDELLNDTTLGLRTTGGWTAR